MLKRASREACRDLWCHSARHIQSFVIGFLYDLSPTFRTPFALHNYRTVKSSWLQASLSSSVSYIPKR